jgi:hypothetical protein
MPDVSMDLSGLNPYVSSLMNRWNDVMAIQTQRLQAAPARDEIAFRHYDRGKRIEEGQAEESSAMRRQAVSDSRRSAAAAEKQRLTDARAAETERRVALQAGVSRNKALHSAYGSPTPFYADSSIADFYEYGAGNPQGRGGGGDARLPSEPGDSDSADWALRNCLQDPAGPGCPGLLRSAGYVEQSVLGGPDIGTTRMAKG